jgi:hypothetical protein
MLLDRTVTYYNFKSNFKVLRFNVLLRKMTNMGQIRKGSKIDYLLCMLTLDGAVIKIIAHNKV